MRLRAAVAVAVALVCLAGALAHASDADAQTPPAPTPPLLPPGGPPEARNCSIPYLENRHPDFDPNGRLTATLDVATGIVTVEVTSLPAGVTCYAIDRQPSGGSRPARQAWSETEITDVEPFVDPEPRNSAGRYCYQLLFGSPAGHSGWSEPVCIEMPASIAPTPTATPTMGPTPPPPGVGSYPPAPTSLATASATPAPPPLGNGLPAEGSRPAVPIAIANLVAVVLGLGASAFARRR